MRTRDRGQDGRQALDAEHRPHAVRDRLAAKPPRHILEDAVLGAVDGSISTFATVAGAVGGGFSALVVAVLGLAKLIADGFSMAVSNYQSASSRQARIEQARRIENHHIDKVPEGERDEIRALFEGKGFSGEILEHIVETITADRELWVETMVREEHRLLTQAPEPLRAASATFIAFLVVGFVPLVPFLVPRLGIQVQLAACGVLTAAAFFGVGVVRGRVLGRPMARSGLGILLTGGAAAALAFVVARLLREALGV